jgi:hypothetical protein
MNRSTWLTLWPAMTCCLVRRLRGGWIAATGPPALSGSADAPSLLAFYHPQAQKQHYLLQFGLPQTITENAVRLRRGQGGFWE